MTIYPVEFQRRLEQKWDTSHRPDYRHGQRDTAARSQRGR
jgi:hypothetical protein